MDYAVIDSPRKGECVYLLCQRLPSGEIRPLGTAFAVECRSKTLLLTALHCVIDESTAILLTDLFIVDGLERVTGQEVLLSTPINVSVVQASDVAIDVACLKAEVPFKDAISLCPITELPSLKSEYKVKAYHCPVRIYLECVSPIINVTSTAYSKVVSQSHHHIFVSQGLGLMQGSSGGPVVDSVGRLIGIIRGGLHIEQPPINQPTDELQVLNTLWEQMTHMSESYSSLVSAVIASKIINLPEYLACH